MKKIIIIVFNMYTQAFCFDKTFTIITKNRRV